MSSSDSSMPPGVSPGGQSGDQPIPMPPGVSPGGHWRPSGALVATAFVAIALGAFGLGLVFATSAREGWLWLIFDFTLFWGIAAGMIAWAAAFRTAQATWTSVINRFAHSAIATAPFLFVMLIALLVGLGGYAPWIAHPIREKQAWLNATSFSIREIVIALIFWLPAFALVRLSLAADAAGGVTSEAAHRLNGAAAAVVVLFAVVASIVSWDFVMSLTPVWVSTMFSAYYFCTSAYAALAVLVIMASALRVPMRLEDRLKPHLFQDMGNLLLAFSLFDMGLFFAQYLTIWYENLPEEVRFLILRYDKGIWPPIGWTSFILGYAIPFLLLQSRMIKRSPCTISAVAVLILVGVAIERYVLVVPSLVPGKLMIAPAGVLSVIGFGGVFALSIGWLLGRYSPISSADEALREARDGGQ